MRLTSTSIENGKPIAVEFAAGTPDGFAPNRNPQLAWSEVPAGTQSFALLCLDPDVPTVPDTVGRDDIQIPVEQPRTDFVHWAMADIPADVHAIAAGSCSDGFVAKGKQQPAGPAGARQGLNSYTQWFAGNPDMAGNYLGYDGRIRRSTTCACTAISSACSRWTWPSSACPSPSRPPMCCRPSRATYLPKPRCMAPTH